MYKRFQSFKLVPLYIVSTVLGTVLSAATIQAQTLFQQYDTIPTLSRYLNAEDCLAAVSRISAGVVLARPEFADTILFKKGEGNDSTAASAVAIAKQCSARFNPDSVVLTGYTESYADWMQLYLIANRDDAAAIIAQRRIANAKQKPKSSRDLYDVLSGMMEVYGNVRPMRWENLKAIGAQLDEPGVAPDQIELYKTYFTRYRYAESVEDTLAQEEMARRMVALGEAAPPALRERREFTMVYYINFMMLSFLNRHLRMDSLRTSPEAYISLSRAHWKELTKENKLAIPMKIGEKAAPVAADFWYSANGSALDNANSSSSTNLNGSVLSNVNSTSSASTSDHIRPSPGKVGLVVFLRQGCNVRTPMFLGHLDRGTFVIPCWDVYSILRRLAERFPSLEITLVGRTSGYISETGPVAPREEADILQKWWLGYHKLPATLAITNTPFFRLEGVDRRRIDEAVPNDLNYLFDQPGGGRGDEVDSKIAFLIDTNGAVIHSGWIDLKQEQILAEMLEVIGQRKK